MNPDIIEQIETIATFLGRAETIGNLSTDNLNEQLRDFTSLTNQNITERTFFKYQNNILWNEEKINNKEVHVLTDNSVAAMLDKEEKISTKSSGLNWIFNLPFTGIKKLIIDPIINVKNYISSFFWKVEPSLNLKETFENPISENLLEQKNEIQNSLNSIIIQEEEDKGQSSNSINNDNNISKHSLYVDNEYLKQVVLNQISTETLVSTLNDRFTSVQQPLELSELTPHEIARGIDELFALYDTHFKTGMNNPNLRSVLLKKLRNFLNEYNLDYVELPKRISGSPVINYWSCAAQEAIHLNSKNKTIMFFFENGFDSNKYSQEVINKGLNYILAGINRKLSIDPAITTSLDYREAVQNFKDYIIIRQEEGVMPTLVEINEVILKNENADSFFPKQKGILNIRSLDSVYAEILIKNQMSRIIKGSIK